MSESVFTFRTQGGVGVARVTLPEILHPDQLDQMSHQFRVFVGETDLAAYVLDLSPLDYLTSAAIGMLMNAHAHLEAEGRRFAMVARADLVIETLQHTHLEKVFPICADIEEALSAIA